jgi:hypothetical protein
MINRQSFSPQPRFSHVKKREYANQFYGSAVKGKRESQQQQKNIPSEASRVLKRFFFSRKAP